jgi:hypothetical protein
LCPVKGRGGGLSISRPLPRPVANVHSHDFIGRLVNAIENQKWISFYRHQSYAFLISEVAKERYFPISEATRSI